MRRSVLFGWLVVSLMVVLSPMAWASPIDPSWIKGVYDDGDFDDIVVYLTSGTFAVPALQLAELFPTLLSVRVDVVPDEQRDAGTPFSLHVPRAPPAS